MAVQHLYLRSTQPVRSPRYKVKRNPALANQEQTHPFATVAIQVTKAGDHFKVQLAVAQCHPEDHFRKITGKFNALRMLRKGQVAVNVNVVDAKAFADGDVATNFVEQSVKGACIVDNTYIAAINGVVKTLIAKATDGK